MAIEQLFCNSQTFFAVQKESCWATQFWHSSFSHHFLAWKGDCRTSDLKCLVAWSSESQPDTSQVANPQALQAFPVNQPVHVWSKTLPVDIHFRRFNDKQAP